MDELLFDSHSQSLTIWGITIAVLFVIMLIGMCRNFCYLRAADRKTRTRVRNLPLSNMVERLGIPLKQYFNKTSDLDKERHIWACERCPKPDDCVRMFSGEELDPATFCANHERLIELRKHIKHPTVTIEKSVGSIGSQSALHSAGSIGNT